MYDWANSAFITTVVTAVFPIYFASLATAGDQMSKADATGKLSLTTTIAMAIGAVLAPILGAIGDRVPIKKKLLAAFLLIGAGATGAMYFLQAGRWVMAAWLFGVGNVAATCSFVFYDSLLPHIASRDEVDRVSTAGYALGYVGGGILLALQLAAIANPQWFGVGEGSDAVVRAVFVSVAAWWLFFSIPLFRRVPEPPTTVDSNAPRTAAIVGRSLVGLIQTLRELKHHRQALLFMFAFLIYNDGIGTIIRMAAIYGDEIGIESGILIQAILMTQFIGIPCSFAFGGLAGKLGTKKAIFVGLSVYCLVSVLGYFMSEGWHFLLLAALVGMVQGGTQALSRSLFSSLIPKQKSAEFFGLFAVFERFAGVLGPLVFTLVIVALGSSRTAILSVIGFFIIGAFLLTRVDVEAGQAAAREAEQP
ncbi:MAG: MFS transporter [Deltaproteobacteria bacterium]|nr:MFS transporter [Deltaproteobacteria bacterium]